LLNIKKEALFVIKNDFLGATHFLNHGNEGFAIVTREVEIWGTKRT
jgi:hypothetical protein